MSILEANSSHTASNTSVMMHLFSNHPAYGSLVLLRTNEAVGVWYGRNSKFLATQQ